jgi:hypothetical protein
LRALKGINSSDQGNFSPDQGIPRSFAIWAFALPTNPIVPTDLEHCREGEQRRRQMLKLAKPISSSGRLRACERRLRHAANHRARRRERSGFPASRTEPTVDGGPRVRILLPPAESLLRTDSWIMVGADARNAESLMHSEPPATHASIQLAGRRASLPWTRILG